MWIILKYCWRALGFLLNWKLEKSPLFTAVFSTVNRYFPSCCFILRHLFFVLFRNLSAIQDREICCYSVSCKEKDNIGRRTLVELEPFPCSTYLPSVFIQKLYCVPVCRHHAAVAHPALKVKEKLKAKPHPQLQLWPRQPRPLIAMGL